MMDTVLLSHASVRHQYGERLTGTKGQAGMPILPCPAIPCGPRPLPLSPPATPFMRPQPSSPNHVLTGTWATDIEMACVPFIWDSCMLFLSLPHFPPPLSSFLPPSSPFTQSAFPSLSLYFCSLLNPSISLSPPHAHFSRDARSTCWREAKGGRGWFQSSVLWWQRAGGEIVWSQCPDETEPD